MKTNRLFLLIVLLIVVAGCRNKAEKPTNLIARVNNRQITLEEFRRFYELDPNFGVDSTGYSALRDELNKYIDRTIALEKAEKEGFTKDSLFQKARNWELQQAMLRQLYREEVEKKIKIPEAEIRQAYFRANSQVHVRHLFAKDSAKINRWYRQIKQGASFDSLARVAFHDTLLSKNGGDLGWVKLGGLDEQFAGAVEKLVKNQISPPVKTRWGHHIIQLLDRKDQVLVKEDEFHRQYRSLQKQLKQRKSAKLSHQFISSFMKELNPQPVQSTFLLLWSAIAWENPENRRLGSPRLFDNQLIATVTRRMRQYLDAPLIQMRNGKMTMREYLQGLKEIPISNRPRFQTPRQLSNQIGIYIRDQLLLGEARRKGLHNHPRVKQEMREFLEEQSYYHYLHVELDSLKIPDWVNDFFVKKDTTQLYRHPALAVFHTLQEWTWWRAERKAHSRLREMKPNIFIDEQKLRLENRRIDWQNRIRMFAVRKPS
ncbi:MAG TPA: hypothetical protein ENK14_05645 [Caldithrix sp.]|nr:hypothetical protein [Caldithrix sp.]